VSHFHVICVKKQSCCCEIEIETHFRSSPTPRFTEKVLDDFSQFMHPKKLSSHTFWKFSNCKVFKKGYWRMFTIFGSKKTSCLPWSFDAFWKFSACRIYRKKLWVHFHDLCVTQPNILDFNSLWKSFGPVLEFYTPINLCCVVWTHCEVLDLHIS